MSNQPITPHGPVRGFGRSRVHALETDLPHERRIG